jgi:hypothetical protein
MNKIILKQISKEKEKQKPKKKQTLRITQDVIQNKLLRHFQYHIGEQDKTTSEEIFQVIIGVNSNAVDSYARFYWFDIIQKMMRKLRREDKCFIIKKDKGWFVLQSMDECKYYQGLCDNAIGKMKKAKIRAEQWVQAEAWKHMQIPNEEEVEKPELKEKLPEEKLDDYKNKLKTKVIKLWEGNKK